MKPNVDALIEFATGLALCPCCCETDKCILDCTYAFDSEGCADGRARYEMMLNARRALREFRKGVKVTRGKE